MDILEKIKFDDNGLVPAIAQDYKTNEVLMMAYMNREALEKTIDYGTVHYYSRSRKKLWHKGEESGHKQFVKDILIDCDNDTILLKVKQVKAACHTGHYSCFYTKLKENEFKEIDNIVFDKEVVYSKAKILSDVYNIVLDRKENPKEGSYTNYLLDKGIDKILKKVGEESAEIIIASKNNSKDEIQYEIADLMYHLMVLMVDRNVTWEDIYEELQKRK